MTRQDANLPRAYLEGEEDEEGHHQAEQTHGFREGEAQHGVREKLLFQRRVAGISHHEVTEHAADTSSTSYTQYRVLVSLALVALVW